MLVLKQNLLWETAPPARGGVTPCFLFCYGDILSKRNLMLMIIVLFISIVAVLLILSDKGFIPLVV